MAAPLPPFAAMMNHQVAQRQQHHHHQQQQHQQEKQQQRQQQQHQPTTMSMAATATAAGAGSPNRPQHAGLQAARGGGGSNTKARKVDGPRMETTYGDSENMHFQNNGRRSTNICI